MEIECHRKADSEECTAPGDFYWHEHNGIRYFCYRTPFNNNGSIPVKTGAKEARFWQWDGNEDQPTISPSIKEIPSPRDPTHKWHGWVKNGKMTGA